MAKALHAPQHQRHTALHPANEAKILSGIASVPRTDGRKAVLVNPRRAVFDEVVAREADQPDALQPIRPADAVWDHAGFTRWTPDLVHYRLVCAGETIARLPSGRRADFVSMIGAAALAEMADKPRKASPSPAEISRLDWTWDQISVRPATQRVILVGMMFDMGQRKIARILAAMGNTAVSLKKSAVGEWYTQELTAFAKMWQAGVRVDPVTRITRQLGPHALLDLATIERFRADHERAEN